MNATVTVVGEGRLADFVCDRLGTRFRLIRQLDLKDGAPKQADLALLLSDGWQPLDHWNAEEVFRTAGTAWLRGFVAFGEGVVGPLVRPHRQGCSQCADMRRVMGGGNRGEMWALRQQMFHQGGTVRDVWASRTALQQMALLLAEEAGRLLRSLPAYTDNGGLYLINLSSLSISRHRILPDPLCDVCGKLPDDTAATAVIGLRPNPKPDPASYRTRRLDEFKTFVMREYHDYRTGLLNGKTFDLQSPFADASVNLPLFGGDEGTAGRTHRYSDSLMTAVLEGLERHCGMNPRGKRTVIRDSWLNLRDTAINPLQVGTHAREQYDLPDFPFRAFDPERVLDWVWGYSLNQMRPILVPETLAYYGTGCGQGFVYETSNGCALGGSLEEAVFYAILEVVERDSFLLTWYAQLPLPGLDPGSAADPELRLMIDRLNAVTGFEILLFNSTMEHGIPSVWSLAKNRSGKGVNLIAAAGAHPDPERAAKSSVHELAAMLLSLNDKLEANRHLYERMVEDPFSVRQMDDHSMLYALPEAEPRLGFLLDGRQPLRTFEEQYKPAVRYPDLTDDLRELLHKLRNVDLDVIVVDQSTPETRRNGLHCVKALIPGMLPMTFGYHLTRLTGLDRVLNVPAALGYAKKPLTHAQLNPHPHPFP